MGNVYAGGSGCAIQQYNTVQSHITKKAKAKALQPIQLFGLNCIMQ